MMRKLSNLVAGLARVDEDASVVDLTISSRDVTPGAAFFACQGRTTHGLLHVNEALTRGARAVVWEPAAGVEAPTLPEGVASVSVPSLGRRLGEIADRFFDAPSRSLTIIGVTGTNGKTTTAWLLAQALTACGRDVRYSGTLGAGRTSALLAATHTTPDAITVQRQLATFRDEGADGVAIEVSSHALDQARVGGVRFHTAVFTNLTRDHLDYHGTMDAYADAKARLFRWDGLRARVINVDDEFGRELAASHEGRGELITVSRQPGRAARVFADAVHLSPSGIELDVTSDWGSGRVSTGLVGDFNADNVLAVLAVLLAWGIAWTDAVAAIAQCTPPAGRMERFGGAGDEPLVIVDYAHTPDALQKALNAARAHARGRLHVVFGCGGDRDRGKRPLMAAVAATAADDIVLTDDNPRTEDPDRIVAEIRAGLSGTAQAVVQHDRARAIRETVHRAAAGDVVVIAGKGHEDYQILSTGRVPFSDQSVVRDALASSAARSRA